jgi:hypothetical protein
MWYTYTRRKSIVEVRKWCNTAALLPNQLHGGAAMDATILPHGRKKEKTARLRSSTNEFIQRAIAVHGDRYDYSITEYKGRHAKLLVACRVHGAFEQDAGNHLGGAGCPSCGAHRSKTHRLLDNDAFLARARRSHGDKYDYSKVSYSGKSNQVVIICPEHGEFSQIAGHHMRGVGCPNCGGRRKWTLDEFVNKSISVHGDKYDYSLVEYIRARSSVRIICKLHGEFLQSPAEHKAGGVCPECRKVKLSVALTSSTDEFVSKATLVHGDRYDYSLVDYVSSDSYVKILCRKHGMFEQKAHQHLTGHGCHKCSVRKGEQMIAELLDAAGVLYYTQVAFSKCVDKLPLWFDFYLPSKRMLIEFDGDQHFRAKAHWGGEEAFENTKRRDAIKNEFAKSNHYNLIRLTCKDLRAGTLEESLFNLLYCVPVK